MTVFLEGIAARFYRGIGEELQYIGPFGRLNFFIGPNNSGKSVVLNLLAEQVPLMMAGRAGESLQAVEAYRGAQTGHFRIGIGRAVSTLAEVIYLRRAQRLFMPRNRNSTLMEELVKIGNGLSFNGLVWGIQDEKGFGFFKPSFTQQSLDDTSPEWQAVWSVLADRSGGSYSTWFPETLSIFAKHIFPTLPPIHLIPAKRILGNKDEAFDDLSGKGVIDHLATLQNPDHDQRENREKFDRINSFLQQVTGKDDAILEVPHHRDHLLVHMDNKVLPLASLGTGIHEVVLIAAFCTIHDGSILCIEEPEIHLHPLLQRKLVAYLQANTKSQYFIATHSAAFIDTPGAHIFRVTNDGVQTRVSPAVTRDSLGAILDDLGCLASDILQANAVIWVEGPSDRIYLNHWIKATDPRLQEGIDYTIMFYGGALIGHLTASDDAVSAFIRLRDLNRNMAIVIDSDRDSADAPLKPHAKRLFDEMAEGPGMVWVTKGREVENYLDHTALHVALKEIHSGIYDAPCGGGPYDHAFHFMRTAPKPGGKRQTCKDADKVGAARRLCQLPADLDRLDLRARLAELTAMIRAANGEKTA